MVSDDIPIYILQAKELKEEISGHEMIGLVYSNGKKARAFSDIII